MRTTERSLADALGWMRQGTELFFGGLDRLPDTELSAATALEGWTRAHVVAHLAANAEGLSNLVHWARTGEPTPMYSSLEQRDADIENGARRSSADLRTRAHQAAADLAAGIISLSDEQWSRPVRTAQGRTVPAAEVPWMRSREVMVHAVDLEAGIGFGDLPVDFLAALVDEIVAKRSAEPGPALLLVASDGGHRWTVEGTGDVTALHGPLAGLAAYLTGRAHPNITAADGRPLSSLPRWL